MGIALLNRPKILLLDEPTTGLDPAARREVWDILEKLKNESGTSLILTTHYMEEAEKLCDYIIILDHGVILREGTLDQLLKQENTKNIVEFTLISGQDLYGVFDSNSSLKIHWNKESGRGSIELQELETELPAFLALLKDKNLKLEKLGSRRVSLDDMFISLTGRHLHE